MLGCKTSLIVCAFALQQAPRICEGSVGVLLGPFNPPTLSPSYVKFDGTSSGRASLPVLGMLNMWECNDCWK